MIIASDFDGTLTTGEMWRGVSAYVSDHGRRWKMNMFLYPRLPIFLLTRVGLLDRRRVQQNFMHKLPMVTAGMSTSEVREMAHWVVENELWNNRRQAVLAELEQYRQQGHRVIVISGAYQPILEMFTARMGEGYEAIGTPLEFSDGKLSGKLAGALNVGEAKADRLRAAVGDQGIDIAYGDTMNDLPMLKLAKTPIVVKADEELANLARAMKWRIIEK
ncbi:MAG: HAD-IB family phosphatase [Anaerolineae bacterium]|nr:HAD-IB family phosphatase [Anaerolineae bacterium]